MTVNAVESRHLTVNTVLTVPPSRMVINEEQYLTAPCIMIVEGVLNQGYIPSDELHAVAWAGVPITLGHPHNAEGLPHSARQPEVLAACGLGHVYHTSIGTGHRKGQAVTSLHGELWINLADVARCGAEAQQVVDMLDTQTPLEISTAFFSQAEQVRGSFLGVPYREIHRQLVPDHLALLPNDIGACSILDGCGAPRLHQQACDCADPYACQCHSEAQEETPKPWWSKFIQAIKSYVKVNGPSSPHTNLTNQDIIESLYAALAREFGQDYTPYFLDTINATEMSFTYRQGERLLRRHWTMEDGVLTLSPDVEDVQRRTEYVPVTQQAEEEESLMVTEIVKRRVDALIANTASGWREEDRHFLERQDEAFLLRLEHQPLTTTPPTYHPPATMQEAIATLPGHLREPMQAMTDEYEERKARAMAILIANEACPFQQEELQGWSAQRLEQLVTMSGGEVPPRPGSTVVERVEVRDYSGRRVPRAPGTEEENQPPPPPNTFSEVVRLQRERGMLVRN